MSWQAGDVREFFADLAKDKATPYRMVPHTFGTPKKLPWLTYCQRCGHVVLKNEVSAQATKLGCEYTKSPWWKRWAANGYKLVDGRPQA